MDSIKLYGIKKEYKKTDTTFIKKGMWPERYLAEVRGIGLAQQAGIPTPLILSSALNDFGGQIVLRRIYYPRLDQVLWRNPDPSVFREVGVVLARIHNISVNGPMSMHLVNRRFRDLKIDVLVRGMLPVRIIDYVSQAFKAACTAMSQHETCFIHGDYTIQNMFYNRLNRSLIVFDWEHFSVCSPVYDIGVLLSFMILLVTDGGWSFTDYFKAITCFFEGYESYRPITKDKWIINVLRFLGHRQIPQYYLFILEYLTVIEQNQACASILKGTMSIHNAIELLSSMGLNFDQTWRDKILKVLQAGDYRISIEPWNWYRKEGLL